MRFSQQITHGFETRIVATIAFALLLPNFAIGQSTFDLEPPLQSETETTEILMSPDPNSIPTFAFVVASLDDDGHVAITRSVPNQEPIPMAAAQDGVPYTEMVTQNFTVMVRVKEMVDGKEVTRHKPETRTRQVAVTRIRKFTPEEQEAADEKAAKEGKSDEEKPVVKQIQVPYTVKVPFEEDVDGIRVTKVREVKQMRTVSVMRGKTKTTASVSTEIYRIADLKCFGADGSPLDEAEIKRRLAEKAAVILIKDPKAITPYFESILKPDAMFMVRPE